MKLGELIVKLQTIHELIAADPEVTLFDPECDACYLLGSVRLNTQGEFGAYLVLHADYEVAPR